MFEKEKVMNYPQFKILLASLGSSKAKWGVAEYKGEIIENSVIKALKFVTEIKEVSLDEQLIDDKTGKMINEEAVSTLLTTIKGFKDDYTSQGIRNVKKAYIGMPVETKEAVKHNDNLLRHALTSEYKKFKVAPWFEALGGYFEAENALLIEADDKTTIYVKLSNHIANEHTTQCLGYEDFSKIKETAKNGLMSSVLTGIGYKVLEFTKETKDLTEITQKLRGLLDQTKAGLFNTVVIKKIGQTALDLSGETKDDNEFLEKFREVTGKENLNLRQDFYQGIQGILGLGINLDVMRDELFDGDAGLPKTMQRVLGEVDINLRREVARNVKIFGKLTNLSGFSDLINEKIRPLLQVYGTDIEPEIIEGEDIEMKGLLKYADGKI